MKNMKKLFVVLSLFVAMTCVSVAAQAQSNQKTNVGQLVSGLINVNVGAVAVNIGDITIDDVIDVNNVLNNNEVRILNNVLNNSPILSNNSNILTNLLRDANILTGTQVVVGVLSSGLFAIQEATAQ
jgi:hypothetical protein